MSFVLSRGRIAGVLSLCSLMASPALARDARPGPEGPEIRIQRWRIPANDGSGRLLVAKVIRDLNDRFEREVPGRIVGERVMEGLRELDKVAYVRFASVYRRFEEVTDFVQVVKRLEETKHDSATFRLPGF